MGPRRTFHLGRASCAVAAIALLGVLFTAPAGAAVLSVNTTADDYDVAGDCSLREAIEAANVNADIGRGCAGVGFGNDTIMLEDPGVYTLTQPVQPASPDDDTDGDLDVDPIIDGDTLTIVPTGTTVLDGGLIDRVLDVLPGGVLTMSGVTVRNGRAQFGGGIKVLAGGATLTLSNSTLSGNRATSGFGGGLSSQGTTTLTNVTVSDNSATNDGGGIDTLAGVTNLNSVTVSDNTGGDGGSGDGGGTDVVGGTLNLRDTLIAGNTDGDAAPMSMPDCGRENPGVLTSLGNNLIGATGDCDLVALGTDITDMPSALSPLADNGGPGFTHALMPGSLAIDAGSAICPAADQRGTARPQGAGCDIGSFELVPTPPVAAQPLVPVSSPPTKAKCKKKKRKSGKGKKRKKCRKKRPAR